MTETLNPSIPNETEQTDHAPEDSTEFDKKFTHWWNKKPHPVAACGARKITPWGLGMLPGPNACPICLALWWSELDKQIE